MSVAAAGGLLALGNSASAAETPAAPAAPAIARPAPAMTRPAGMGMTNRFQAPDRLAAMAKRLELTDDQKPKVKAVLDEETALQTEFRQKAKDMTPEQRRARYMEIRSTVDTKIKAVLTPAQLEKWETARGRRPAGTPGAAPAAVPAK